MHLRSESTHIVLLIHSLHFQTLKNSVYLLLFKSDSPNCDIDDTDTMWLINLPFSKHITSIFSILFFNLIGACGATKLNVNFELKLVLTLSYWKQCVSYFLSNLQVCHGGVANKSAPTQKRHTNNFVTDLQENFQWKNQIIQNWLFECEWKLQTFK